MPGGGVCMFPFEELCGRPVAAADYIALAERFHTVALEGVPAFSGATRSQVCLWYHMAARQEILYYTFFMSCYQKHTAVMSLHVILCAILHSGMRSSGLHKYFICCPSQRLTTVHDISWLSH